MKHTLVSALALLALCSCGSKVEGMQLHFNLALKAASTAQADGSSRTFTNAQGDRITLTRVYVNVSSVEIAACPKGAMWRWLQQLSPIGTAEAHTTSSPLKLGEPHVNGLGTVEGESRELGTLAPPPGSYCRANVVLEPADDDAEGLPSDVNMVGKTLLLEGQLVPAGGGAAQPFHVESSGTALVELTLEGLSLSEDAPEASRLISLAYDRWLEGVDPSAAEAGDRVLDNVSSTASVKPSN